MAMTFTLRFFASARISEQRAASSRMLSPDTVGLGLPSRVMTMAVESASNEQQYTLLLHPRTAKMVL